MKKFPDRAYRNWVCASMLLMLPITAYASDDIVDYDQGILKANITYIDEEVEPTTIESTGTSHVGYTDDSDNLPGGQLSRTSNYGVLGNRDTMSTPFNVTTFTNKAIADKQAQTVNDIIANDASTTNMTLSTSSQAWSIRGIRSTQQDVSFNGLYGVAPRFYAGIEGLERVEVLKGPSALLYGMSPNGKNVGGNINYVPKRAHGGENQNSITLSYGEGNQFGQNLDLSQRSEDGVWGARLNAYHSNGSTYWDDEQIKTQSVTLGVDRKGNRSRLSFDLGYAYNSVENPQYRVTLTKDYLNNFNSLPSADNNINYNWKGTKGEYAFRHVTEKYGIGRYEYDFNKNWMGYVTAGMRSTDLDSRTNTYSLDYKNTDGVKWNTGTSINNAVNKAISAEVGVKGKFTTGSLKHEVTVAANRYSMKRTTKGVEDQHPIYSGLAITDVMTTANDKWTFILGGRHQNVKDLGYDEDAWTPAFGLVYKVNPRTSFYANYIEGLAAGDAVANDQYTNGDYKYTNHGQIFAPYKTKQYEIGAKFDLGKYLATVSAFEIRQNGTVSTNLGANSNGNTIYTQSETKVRHRGVELSVAGEPTKGTRIMGSLMFMNATYRDVYDNNYIGNTEFGIPKWTAVMGLEQDIKSVKGLSLNTRLTYNGSAYYNIENTYKVASWWKWDLGARYEFTGWGHPMTLRADVYNVLDKDYWVALQDNSALFSGKGRTMALSLETKF